MAIAFPSTASDITSSGGTSPVVLNKPANAADGDLLVAVVISRNNVPTAPSGWTLAQGTTSTNGGYGVFSMTVPSASGLASSWSWPIPGGSIRSQGILFRVTGVNLSSPTLQVGTAVSGGADGPAAIPMTLPGVSNVNGYMAFLGSFWTETVPDNTVITDMTLLATGSTSNAGPGRSALGIWVSTTAGNISQENTNWSQPGETGELVSFTPIAAPNSRAFLDFLI